MANSYFNGLGQPVLGAGLSSSDMRAIFAAIVAGFDKLPALGAGQANRDLRVNAAGTAIVATFATQPVATAPITADMVGSRIRTAAGVTIPVDVFQQGDIIYLYNNSGASITLTADVGLTLRLAGTTTTGNRTLLARGLAQIWFDGAADGIVSGNVT